MTFKKEWLRDVLGGDKDKAEIVSNEVTDTSRWSLLHTLIFKTPDEKLWDVAYSEGATECQDESPFEYADDDVECTEVEAYEKTVTAYRPVASGM